MRAGLRTISEVDESILIVGEAANAAETILAVRELHPDAILLDADAATVLMAVVAVIAGAVNGNSLEIGSYVFLGGLAWLGKALLRFLGWS